MSEGPAVSRGRAFLEASILIPGLFVVVLAAGAVATSWLGLPRIPPPWSLFGIPVVAASGAILVYTGAFLSRRGAGTPYPRRPPTHLVTDGPFAFVRNPMTVSWGVLILGLGLAMGWTALFLLMVPAGLVIHLYFVFHEEPRLVARFGAEYEAYRARVPRWIPRPPR